MQKVKPGNIIFVRPNNFAFKVIRWVTKGKFGHVGMVVGCIEDHTIIAEAGINGIDTNDLKWRVVKKENYSIYRLKNIDDEMRHKLVLKALQDVGLRYDKAAILNFIIG